MAQILGKKVGPIGYGLMSFGFKQALDDGDLEIMHTALQQGCTFWNGGEFYGPEDRNSLVLLEKYFSKYPEDADKVLLSIKGGVAKPMAMPMKFDTSPEGVRRSVSDCDAQLKGRKKMDLFEVARGDGVTPWETTLETLDKEFVQTGIIGGISLSEVRAETIHRAVKITKICAVEVELSLMTTDVLTNGIAEACAKYGIPLIAYSPIGRGLLGGKFKSLEDVDPLLRNSPRFSPENFPVNIQLAEQVRKLAEKKGCTLAQFAINWVRCLSKKPGMPTIIPIPGGKSIDRVIENSRVVDITEEEMAEIDAILAKFEVKGARYPDWVPVNT